MINKRKSGRTLNNIGIRWHNFDFQSEKNIYSYLCCDKMKKRALKKLDEKLKFVSYSQWKQYICNKYENYNKDELIEFSRYLNQRIRNINPSREYLNIILPCFITLAFTVSIDKILDLNLETTSISDLGSLIIIIFLSILFIISMFSVIRNTFIPIKENSGDTNILIDYKEIIDEMISMK